MDAREMRERRRRKNNSQVGAVLLLMGFIIGVVALVWVVVWRANNVPEVPPGGEKGKAVAVEKSGAERKPPVSDTGESGRERDRDRERVSDAVELGVWLYVGAVVLYVVLVILLAVWVIRDSRNRSIENGVIWMLLIFPFNVLALFIYLASRPHGTLTHCEHCGNRRLRYVGVCPHCRKPVRSRGRGA